jgi:predicted glycogen debranching enzyme
MYALPGLLKAKSDLKTCEEILQANLKRLDSGLMPKFVGHKSLLDAADAPLLAFVVLQNFLAYKTKKDIWKTYGEALKSILANYRKGTHFNIHMQENGLIHAKYEGVALTWMDSYIDGKPVTPRGGLAVEINALWYNAVCLALDLATASGDKQFVAEWKELPAIIGKSFLETFWSDKKEYLADYADGSFTDWSVRPNMIIAASQLYTPLSRDQKKLIVSKVKNTLLTSRGLRSLAPEYPAYLGECLETANEYSAAAHQGSVYPYLIFPFLSAYLDIHKAGGLSFVKNIIEKFEEEMSENCIGTLSELYEGNPPHSARGAISQAWNVSGVLNAIALIEHFEENNKNIHSI